MRVLRNSFILFVSSQGISTQPTTIAKSIASNLPTSNDTKLGLGSHVLEVPGYNPSSGPLGATISFRVPESNVTLRNLPRRSIRTAQAPLRRLLDACIAGIDRKIIQYGREAYSPSGSHLFFDGQLLWMSIVSNSHQTILYLTWAVVRDVVRGFEIFLVKEGRFFVHFTFAISLQIGWDEIFPVATGALSVNPLSSRLAHSDSR